MKKRHKKLKIFISCQTDPQILVLKMFWLMTQLSPAWRGRVRDSTVSFLISWRAGNLCPWIQPRAVWPVSVSASAAVIKTSSVVLPGLRDIIKRELTFLGKLFPTV